MYCSSPCRKCCKSSVRLVRSENSIYPNITFKKGSRHKFGNSMISKYQTSWYQTYLFRVALCTQINKKINLLGSALTFSTNQILRPLSLQTQTLRDAPGPATAAGEPRPWHAHMEPYLANRSSTARQTSHSLMHPRLRLLVTRPPGDCSPAFSSPRPA